MPLSNLQTTHDASNAGPAHGTDVARPDPYRRQGLVRRVLPFVLTACIALALLPLQEVSVDGELLVASFIALVTLGALTLLHESLPTSLRAASVVLLPALYLSAIELLRDATGSAGSGYGTLMYLAPFWSALYGSRRQVLLTTGLMFVISTGVLHGHWDLVGVRRAALQAFVIGLMSIAVQRQVTELVVTGLRLARESEARTQSVRKLEQVNDALERSNHDLEQFAYVSSHDLQEPLRMIRSFNQLYLQRYGDELDDEARELLDFVADGAARAQDLVHDLLEYSRVGMQEPELTRIDLGVVVDRSLQNLAAAIDEHDAKIERTGALPTVQGDELKLVRLFTNLIGNAIKYHHPDRTPVIAIVSQSVGDGRFRIDVVDNGIGFDVAHKERIFRMFQRLHLRDEYPGTGIGLAICARIAEQHHATMLADGTPGRGATFSIVIEGEA